MKQTFCFVPNWNTVCGKLKFSRWFFTFHANISSLLVVLFKQRSFSPSVLIFCLELAALTLLSTGHLSTTNIKATHLPDNLPQDWLKTGNDGSEIEKKKKERKHNKRESPSFSFICKSRKRQSSVEKPQHSIHFSFACQQNMFTFEKRRWMGEKKKERLDNSAF